MLTEYADRPDGNVLFEAAFVPSEEFAHKGVAAGGPEIGNVLGRKSRVLVGTPQSRNVLAHWPENDALDADIVAQRHDWDFFRVRLACSFVPARGSRLTWVRLSAALTAERASDEGDGAGPACVVFDLFPRDVTRERHYKRSFSITPSLKFAFAELGAQASTESDAIGYEPEMDAAGLLTPTPTWTFRSGDGSGLVGSRELFILVKAPKGSNVTGQFHVGAELHSRLGPIPLRSQLDDLSATTYVLAP
jgi:hypothetical protein